jgi:hypothetical protein
MKAALELLGSIVAWQADAHASLERSHDLIEDSARQ